MNDNELADWLDYFSDLSGHKRMTEAAARLRHLAMLEDGEPMVPELLYEATFGAMEDMRAENERLRTVVGDMDAIIGDVVRERDAARAENERLRAAIVEHQTANATPHCDDDACPRGCGNDRKLYAVLDNP